MEAEELQTGSVHHGHNIRRARRMRGVKQLALADMLEMSQQTISRYESMAEIEDSMLHKFAKALNVSVEYLKTMEESASTIVFETNNVTNNNAEGAQSTTNTSASGNDSNTESNDTTTNTFNPMDKIVELYERLLQDQQEKYAALEQRLQALERR